ncbi:acyltransferase [Corynebacterium alimapuense]|uniref:Acyltransferase n=2 Tax=Corynebacterium alimapuense TaxID=1576874 RepID=A0A3M8KB93_9CORY|nr:acyltransferase [Corynebacterium alimapuense]
MSPFYKPAHISSLEGVRAVAALGVILAHVSFQTGMDPASPIGAVLARFDFFVPAFFALSGFLLWRGHRHDRTGAQIGRYLVNRVARILPAYLVCVLAVILLLPEAGQMSSSQIVANLTLTQVFAVDGLAPGLTHLWSLSVEMAFYLVLPLLALSLGRLPRRARIAAILVAGLLSLGWAYLPLVMAGPDLAAGIANRQIWPPAYTLWFAVGLLSAEFEGRVPPLVDRALRVRWLWWVLALITAWIAGQEWFGPLGLVHPDPSEFARRVIAGTVFAVAVVCPQALAPGGGWLASPLMQSLGRWSYSIFLWHLAMLSLAFPLAGIGYFQGGFVIILALTLIMTLPVAAASYLFVEAPAARWGRQVANRLARAATQRSITTSESPA